MAYNYIHRKYYRVLSMKTLQYILVVSIIFITGCTTSPVSVESAKNIPNERILVKNTMGDSKVIVTRDSGMLGSGCNLKLLINDTEVAIYAAGETATFNVSHGLIVFGLARGSSGLCALNGNFILNYESHINESSINYYRIVTMGNGGLDIQRSK